jgi:hypothetical protein
MPTNSMGGEVAQHGHLASSAQQTPGQPSLSWLDRLPKPERAGYLRQLVSVSNDRFQDHRRGILAVLVGTVWGNMRPGIGDGGR